MVSADELGLVKQSLRGDDRAYSRLVEISQGPVRGFLRRYAGHWADADDLAQEAFVVAWSKLARFDGRTRFSAWVCGIGYRLARDARRARQRSDVRELNWFEEMKLARHQSVPDDRIIVARAMEQLSEPQRATVALCLGEGFSHSEAAEILALPLGTVKSHVMRGREKLLQVLQSEEDDHD